MTSNQKSTLNKPLLSLQEFLKSDNFNIYEKNFYEMEVNPSMESFKEKGYIEYIESDYTTQEIVPTRVYFRDRIFSIITLHKNISINLIREKVEEIENSGNSTHNYISKIKHQIIELLEDVAKYNKLFHEISPILKEINSVLNALNQEKFESKKVVNRNNIQNGYFSPIISANKLSKIYEIAIELNILDFDEVSKEDFIEVFTHPNPKLIESKITFVTDNRRAFFFLNNIKKFFYNLTPSRISNSMSFFSKGTQNKNSVLLKQSNIDRINNDLRKIDVSKYEDILTAIKSMEEKYHF